MVVDTFMPVFPGNNLAFVVAKSAKLEMEIQFLKNGSYSTEISK